MVRRISLFLTICALAWARTPRPIADVAINLPNGKKVQATQYKGKAVALVLFSTQCGPCIDVVNMLAKAQKTYGARGYQPLGAAVNIDASTEIQSWVDRYRPSFPVGYLDQPGLLKIADLGPQDRPFVPILIFIDKSGIVRYQYLGNDPVLKELPSIIDGLADKMTK